MSLELHCCSSLQCSEQMNNEEKKCKERAIVKQDLFNWSKVSSIHRCGKGLEAKISGLQVQDSFH